MKKQIIIKYYFDDTEKLKFRKWMLDNDLTLSKASVKVGVSVPYIHSIINGKKPISKSVIRMFENLGYKLELED